MRKRGGDKRRYGKEYRKRKEIREKGIEGREKRGDYKCKLMGKVKGRNRGKKGVMGNSVCG